MGAGLLGASAGLTAYGAISQAKTAKAWGRYQKKQSQADALAEIGRSQVEANQFRERAEMERSSAVSAISGSGVVVGEGTASDIEKRILSRGEYDAQMTIFNGQDAAATILAQGKAANIKGKQDAKAAIIGGAGSLLGMGAAYGAWNKSASAPVVDKGVPASKPQSLIINKPAKGFGFF